MTRARSERILSHLNGRSIVLIGMMGSGKSAIGKLLASTLRLPFRDADHEIEEAAGRSVADIFEDYGEAEFRRLETRVIARVLDEGPVMLSLGGGAYMCEETRKAVASSAVSIWLDVDLETLVERVCRNIDKRPLLKTGDPREILIALLEVRSPVYARADIRVRTSGVSKTGMRESVLKRLDDYLSKEAGKQRK